MSDLVFGIFYWGWFLFLLSLMLLTSATIGVMFSVMMR